MCFDGQDSLRKSGSTMEQISDKRLSTQSSLHFTTLCWDIKVTVMSIMTGHNLWHRTQHRPLLCDPPFPIILLKPTQMNLNVFMAGGGVCSRFFMLAWRPSENCAHNLSFLKGRSHCHRQCLQPWLTEWFSDKTTWIGSKKPWTGVRISSELQSKGLCHGTDA